MSFSDIGLLVSDILEQLVYKENQQIKNASAVSEKIKKQLETDFSLIFSPEIKIYR